MDIVSRRLRTIKASPTSMMSSRAMALIHEGRDVIRLSSGEPDFQTPDHIRMAGIRALVEGRTKYTPVPGIPELRDAIVGKLKHDNHLEYTREQVIVSTGGKQAVFNALVASLDPGDEVVIPAPYWVSYPDMTLLAGGKPVPVETEAARSFRLDPAVLEAAITPRTKWLILNSPGNPSGAVYTSEELGGLAEVLRAHPHVWVLSDDIYENILYPGAAFTNIATIAPDLKERMLLVNGFSKGYCMTGWRLGYAAGPLELIRAMAKIQSQSTSGASSIGQWAAVAALTGDRSFMQKNNAIFLERRDLALKILNETPGLSCRAPEGAFYLYISCEGVIGRKTPDGTRIESDENLAEYLLDAVGVALVHGAAFGLSPYFRISYATDTETLKTACQRIQRGCAALA